MVERAGQQDYEEAAEVWDTAVRATHDFLSEVDIRYFRGLILSEALAAVDLYCVREAGRIMGFVGLAQNKVEMLFVRPEAFGKGIGRELMLFAIREKGAFKVDVNEQNPRALRFYEHIGFKVVERHATDMQGNPFPVLSMRLPEATRNELENSNS